MADYFDSLRKELDRAYAVASQARKKGLDPAQKVEIPITKDVATRVEGLVGPPGISEVIRKLEGEGLSRTDSAFRIAELIASGEIIKAGKQKLIEQAVRTSVAVLTEGVLVAPTEGISKVEISENPDGTDYVSVYFAGPIRSSGGTAAALSVVLADVARRKAGIGNYRPTETEIARYVEEVNVYEDRCVHLQYKPPDEHVAHIVRSCPVCIEGDPTEEIEVSIYRDLDRIKSNRVRGGIALVICEGIAQKAPKVLKYAKRVGLDWDWLQKVIKVKKKEDKVEIKPDYTYLEGLVAGRPVFSYPHAKGGFRLRYGRSRTNGLMARNIHPATMVLLDCFPANGTHMKVERPGKGCVVTVCDSIEPPVVKLKDGSVQKVRTSEDAAELRPEVEQILFLGDMLITYGDFLKSNHPLLQSGACMEWWKAELEQKDIAPEKIASAPEAFSFSRENGVSLHPDYTLPWHDISNGQLEALAAELKSGKIEWEGDKPVKFSLPDGAAKAILECLLVEHRKEGGMLAMSGDSGYVLLASLGLVLGRETDFSAFRIDGGKTPLENVCALSGITVRAKNPTYIGARMGRPEKSRERAMAGEPSVLFPTGSSKNRSILKLYKMLKERKKERSVNVDISRFRCTACGRLTAYPKCNWCDSPAVPERVCRKCKAATKEGVHCDVPTVLHEYRPIDMVELLDRARADTGFMPQELKGVKGLFNETKMPERIEKGFYRSKHGIFVFKDGTSRLDSTDAPITHFRPSEIGQAAEGIRKLGYEKDVKGEPITSGEQVIPLQAQDVIVSRHGLSYLARVARFIDDLLVNFYGLPPFYNVEKDGDLIGHLVAGLSPHTSTCVLARIIGCSDANVGYAHPYFHTAKRRNCDGDEDGLMLLMDALLNFSRSYLAEKRGGTMDAPILLTPRIDPAEVDDEVHCMEVVQSYPLEFYEACERNAFPGDVSIRRVKNILGRPEEYGDLNYMFDTAEINEGPMVTRYVELGSIPEKIDAEFALHAILRPVDLRDSAERLILSHFIPDLYGNLRSFSRQSFRCVDCNLIYRRPPLVGKCTKCGGKLILTINKGGIEKYLKVSQHMAEEYGLPDYLKQRLKLVEAEIKSVFEDENVQQTGLSDFM